MLNPSELKFFTDNKERIFDLIRAVDQHENIRSIIGPTSIEYHPQFIGDYVRAHEIMSRLSSHLYSYMDPHTINFGPQNDHIDIPDRIGLDLSIKMSC